MCQTLYSKPSKYFAELYKQHNLTGGHVIKLGPGNDEAAEEALAAWPSEQLYLTSLRSRF
jgi:hypothetical protein